MTTTTLQTTQVQELTDQELEQVNGGFFWFLLIPVIKKVVTVAAVATAGHFAVEGTKKSVKALGGSDTAAEVIGEGIGLLV
ncbi:MAG: class IIb bacteriocin, lactobin A/cerein 7B family [Cyanobacteriota bacterium]|nr:class IIb bacteriocin, lactobin A/cerein 7B family [Cyanobacteriota bacterium]